jgi:hypothetical protein
MTTKERLEELRRMAYNAERDGYDRAWHKTVAKNHPDLAALYRGAERASLDEKEDFNNFVPNLFPK